MGHLHSLDALSHVTQCTGVRVSEILASRIPTSLGSAKLFGQLPYVFCSQGSVLNLWDSSFPEGNVVIMELFPFIVLRITHVKHVIQ